MNSYLVHFSLHEVLSPRCSKEWWDMGIEHLRNGGSSASWHTLMYGA